MEFSRIYTTIDAHAAGEPLRIVTGGVPRIPGRDILAKRRWVRENLDDVRRALMLEPRGHADMYGCYLTEPVTPGADVGVIFMHNEGYSDMCGHGVVALATVLVAQAMVPRQVPETRVGIDAPAGFIEAFVAWDGSRTGPVRFRNVPSFLYHRDLDVRTPGFGKVRVDVAFGGAFYAYLEAAQVGLEVRPEALPELVRAGAEIKAATMAELDVRHPLEPELAGIYGTILSEPAAPSSEPHLAGAAVSQRNVCVFADREVDRSPTGTGTAGRVAQLVARGVLAPGQALANQSIVGTWFGGVALERVKVGELDGIVPEVNGSAAIVGMNTWLVDPDDPVGQGFLLR